MTEAPQNQDAKLEAPVFPYYLDEEMVMSFLATIEDGLSIVQKVSQTIEDVVSRELEGEVGGRGIFPPFTASASGRAGRSRDSVSGEVLEYERHYPSIALFNLLREQLVKHNMVTSLTNNQNEALSVGDIVEFEGSIRKNPFVELNEIWNTYLEMRPYFEDASATTAQPNNQRGKSRSSSQQSTSRAALSKPRDLDEERVGVILEIATRGIEESRLLDVSVQIEHKVYESAVLTLRTERNPAQAVAFSRGSKCKVIGKISGITEAGESIRLYRRSSLEMFSTETMAPIIEPMRNLPELAIDLDNVAIEGPAIQILPLAIFV